MCSGGYRASSTAAPGEGGGGVEKLFPPVPTTPRTPARTQCRHHTTPSTPPCGCVAQAHTRGQRLASIHRCCSSGSSISHSSSGGSAGRGSSSGDGSSRRVSHALHFPTVGSHDGHGRGRGQLPCHAHVCKGLPRHHGGGVGPRGGAPLPSPCRPPTVPVQLTPQQVQPHGSLALDVNEAPGVT